MKNKLLLIVLILLLGMQWSKKKATLSDYPIQEVKLNQVILTDSFWLPRIQLIQNKVITHAFEKCQSEGRIENFITAHQVMNGGTGTTQGKMPFDDTDVYKVLEGVAYSLVNNPNPQLEQYSDSIISIIALGQEPDGYITTWRTIDPWHPTSEWVPGGERWSHLEISHELYNSGHLFEAAAAYHWATGKDKLLDIALKNADLLVDVFGNDNHNAVPGHQIVETGLIKLYHITGKEDYLHLAKKFLDLRGDSTARQIWGASNIQDHQPVLQQDEAVGHAVRAVYMYAGMTDIAAIYKDSDYRNAVEKLWENMTHHKMYITGGIGARHHNEEFGDNHELPNLTAYSETCASIGSIYWNDRMFRLTGDAKYYSIIERTLYNGVLAGISLDGTHFFYPNPLECDGEFAFNKGSCTREEWFDCSCCPTNLIRFIPAIPSLIYATHGDELYINLFMANTAQLELPQTKIKIEQVTDYPIEGKIKINVSPETASEFAVKIRVPHWATNQPVPGSLYRYSTPLTDTYTVSINKETMPIESEEGYITLNRQWKEGDEIELNFPMHVRQIEASNQVLNLASCTALEYGPFIYCAEEVDNPDCFTTLTLSAEDNYKIYDDTLRTTFVRLVEKEHNGEIYHFIPYYTWANRGVNKMKVWLPTINNSPSEHMALK